MGLQKEILTIFSFLHLFLIVSTQTQDQSFTSLPTLSSSITAATSTTTVSSTTQLAVTSTYATSTPQINTTVSPNATTIQTNTTDLLNGTVTNSTDVPGTPAPTAITETTSSTTSRSPPTASTISKPPPTTATVPPQNNTVVMTLTVMQDKLSQVNVNLTLDNINTLSKSLCNPNTTLSVIAINGIFPSNSSFYVNAITETIYSSSLGTVFVCRVDDIPNLSTELNGTITCSRDSQNCSSSATDAGTCATVTFVTDQCSVPFLWQSNQTVNIGYNPNVLNFTCTDTKVSCSAYTDVSPATTATLPLQPATSSVQSTTNSLQPTTLSVQSTTNSLQPTTLSVQSTTNSLQPTIPSVQTTSSSSSPQNPTVGALGIGDGEKGHSGVILGVILSLLVVAIALALGVLWWRQRSSKQRGSVQFHNEDSHHTSSGPLGLRTGEKRTLQRLQSSNSDEFEFSSVNLSPTSPSPQASIDVTSGQKLH